MGCSGIRRSAGPSTARRRNRRVRYGISARLARTAVLLRIEQHVEDGAEQAALFLFDLLVFVFRPVAVISRHRVVASVFHVTSECLMSLHSGFVPGNLVLGIRSARRDGDDSADRQNAERAAIHGEPTSGVSWRRMIQRSTCSGENAIQVWTDAAAGAEAGEPVPASTPLRLDNYKDLKTFIPIYGNLRYVKMEVAQYQLEAELKEQLSTREPGL